MRVDCPATLHGIKTPEESNYYWSQVPNRPDADPCLQGITRYTLPFWGSFVRYITMAVTSPLAIDRYPGAIRAHQVVALMEEAYRVAHTCQLDLAIAPHSTAPETPYVV